MTMKRHWNLTRTVCALALAIGLSIAAMPQAEAHPKGYKGHKSSVHHRHYRHDQVRKMPGWLKHDRAFQNWYWQSSHRLSPSIRWTRVYDIYRFERRERLHGSRFVGRVVYDRGQRVYRGRTYWYW